MSSKDDLQEARRVALAQAIKQANENWVYEMQMIALQAKHAKARFDALIREGFAHQDALALCVKRVEF